MKVAHILYSGLGGHGSVFFSLVKAASSNDIAHFPIFLGIEPTRPAYEQQCDSLGIEHYSVLKRPGEYFKPQARIFDFLQKAKADAILVHSVAGLPGAFLYSVLFGGKPLLLIEHQSNLLKTKIQWIISRLAPWLCSKVVYLSDSSRDEIKERIGCFFRDTKQVVIPNGIDIDYFSPKNEVDHRHDNSLPVVGMAARINELKDHETLIKATARAKEMGRPFKLLLAGDGPLKGYLMDLASRLELGDLVCFLGMLNEAALRDFYHSLDVYAHCTLGETMSTSIMQAQSCGLPIIASDVRGVNNHLRADFNGLLVPAQDPDALTKSLQKMISSHELRKSFSMRSRESAEKLYSNRLMRKAYEDLLK